MRISDWSSDVCSSDLVVGLEAQQPDAARAAQLQPAGAFQAQAGGDLVGALRLDQFVDEAADLARVAAGLGRALLAVVQLLDHLHRQEYVVFLELEQRRRVMRSEEHTSELQSLMRISYAVFCL